MPATRKQKEETLKSLKESFKKAKTVVFSQYKGTTVKDMRSLRRKLRENSVEFRVAKKTLMKLAAKEVGFDDIPAEVLEGPIGLAFGMKDEIAPAKVIYEFGKTNEHVKLTGAIFEGKLIGAADAKVIAMLPGREVLLAKLVGCMKSPIAGFHGILHALLRNFVYALSEVQKKKTA